jgi:hypothetical protein
MGAPKHGLYAGKGYVKGSENALTIHEVRAFRNRTPIGTKVKFSAVALDFKDMTFDRPVKRTIEGVITGKFPHVAVLDGKHTYTWKDMMLGGVEVIEE